MASVYDIDKAAKLITELEGLFKQMAMEHPPLHEAMGDLQKLRVRLKLFRLFKDRQTKARDALRTERLGKDMLLDLATRNEI